jgi:hypothetical protein
VAAPTALTTAEVLAARASLSRAAPDRDAVFRALLGRSAMSPRALREWHDLLLFVLAHPSGEQQHTLATRELQRVAKRAEAMCSSSPRHAAALTNSGIAGSTLAASFSHVLVRRLLLGPWRGTAGLLSLEATAEEARETLRTLLLPLERELPDLLEGDASELARQLLGPTPEARLAHLVIRLDASPASDALRAHLFARLQPHLTVPLDKRTGSMTTARAPHGPVFTLPDGPRRGVQLADVLAEPLAPDVPLDTRRRHALVTTARVVLATLQRETDPVTHASTVSLHDMGRGLRIALFSLDMAHRLPFDSYVGFLAFRNGVPLAYGGAWIFPQRSKVGINVFPAQRGGESAWFFAQLLRLYHQRYGVSCFEAENYQLGHGNPEGLRSGAYWFYYRLGFRPTDARLQRVADREFAKLSARRDYAVPMTRLRELVAAGLQLDVPSPARDASVPSATSGPPIDTAALTLAVQRHIAHRYAGDRARAQRTAVARLERLLHTSRAHDWRGTQAEAFDLWALAVDLLPDLEQWSAHDRRALEQVIRAKGDASELSHQTLLAQHRALLDGWRRACAATPTG